MSHRPRMAALQSFDGGGRSPAVVDRRSPRPDSQKSLELSSLLEDRPSAQRRQHTQHGSNPQPSCCGASAAATDSTFSSSTLNSWGSSAWGSSGRASLGNGSFKNPAHDSVRSAGSGGGGGGGGGRTTTKTARGGSSSQLAATCDDDDSARLRSVGSARDSAKSMGSSADGSARLSIGGGDDRRPAGTGAAARGRDGRGRGREQRRPEDEDASEGSGGGERRRRRSRSTSRTREAIASVVSRVPRALFRSSGNKKSGGGGGSGAATSKDDGDDSGKNGGSKKSEQRRRGRQDSSGDALMEEEEEQQQQPQPPSGERTADPATQPRRRSMPRRRTEPGSSSSVTGPRRGPSLRGLMGSSLRPIGGGSSTGGSGGSGGSAKGGATLELERSERSATMLAAARGQRKQRSSLGLGSSAKTVSLGGGAARVSKDKRPLLGGPIQPPPPPRQVRQAKSLRGLPPTEGRSAAEAAATAPVSSGARSNRSDDPRSGFEPLPLTSDPRVQSTLEELDRFRRSNRDWWDDSFRLSADDAVARIERLLEKGQDERLDEGCGDWRKEFLGRGRRSSNECDGGSKGGGVGPSGSASSSSLGDVGREVGGPQSGVGRGSPQHDGEFNGGVARVQRAVEEDDSDSYCDNEDYFNYYDEGQDEDVVVEKEDEYSKDPADQEPSFHSYGTTTDNDDSSWSSLNSEAAQRQQTSSSPFWPPDNCDENDDAFSDCENTVEVEKIYVAEQEEEEEEVSEGDRSAGPPSRSPSPAPRRPEKGGGRTKEEIALRLSEACVVEFKHSGGHTVYPASPASSSASSECSLEVTKCMGNELFGAGGGWLRGDIAVAGGDVGGRPAFPGLAPCRSTQGCSEDDDEDEDEEGWRCGEDREDYGPPRRGRHSPPLPATAKPAPPALRRSKSSPCLMPGISARRVTFAEDV